MAILDFIHSLKDMKNAQIQWAQIELSVKAEALRKIAHKISDQAESLANSLARSQGLPQEFILKNEILATQKYILQVSEKNPAKGISPKPTGFVSILLPEFFSFRILFERLAPALLAGNAVFVFIPSSRKEIKDLVQSLCDETLPVRIFSGEEDLAEILVSHPSIHAVSFYGSPDKAEKVLKLISGQWKKSQISAGFHNSALILNDADLAHVAEQLIESCFLGQGQLHWNISNILVTEAKLQDFQKEFFGRLEGMNFPEMTSETYQRYDTIKNKLKSENGKTLFDGGLAGPLVVQDLSHCSTLQQDCLMAPVVLISPVKYAHEMVKWTNTSYYGMLAQIFGPDEKVVKFGEQLEVSRILANGWVEKMEELPLGIKQSFSGLSTLDPFGGFFSDLRKIDGLESKS
jgi:aminomuconate-semialdehyde/2-hydroxymuconate-6-semialdehyde dehydrogenase